MASFFRNLVKKKEDPPIPSVNPVRQAPPDAGPPRGRATSNSDEMSMFVGMSTHSAPPVVAQPAETSSFSFINSTGYEPASVVVPPQSHAYDSVPIAAPPEQTSGFSFINSSYDTAPEPVSPPHAVSDYGAAAVSGFSFINSPAADVTPVADVSPPPAAHQPTVQFQQPAPDYDAAQPGGIRRTVTAGPRKKKFGAVRPGHDREDTPTAASPASTVSATSAASVTPAPAISTPARVVHQPAAVSVAAPAATPEPVHQPSPAAVPLESPLNLTGLRIRQPAPKEATPPVQIAPQQPVTTPVRTPQPATTAPTSASKGLPSLSIVSSPAPAAKQEPVKAVVTTAPATAATSTPSVAPAPAVSSTTRTVTPTSPAAPATSTSASATATTPSTTTTTTTATSATGSPKLPASPKPPVVEKKPVAPLPKFTLDNHLSMSRFLDEVVKRKTAEPEQQLPAIFAAVEEIIAAVNERRRDLVVKRRATAVSRRTALDRLAKSKLDLESMVAAQAKAVESEDFDTADRLDSEMEQMKSANKDQQAEIQSMDLELKKCDTLASRVDELELDVCVLVAEKLRSVQNVRADALKSKTADANVVIGRLEEEAHTMEEKIARSRQHLTIDLKLLTDQETTINRSIEDQTRDVLAKRTKWEAKMSAEQIVIDRLRAELAEAMARGAEYQAELNACDKAINDERARHATAFKRMEADRATITAQQEQCTMEEALVSEHKTLIAKKRAEAKEDRKQQRRLMRELQQAAFKSSLRAHRLKHMQRRREQIQKLMDAQEQQHRQQDDDFRSKQRACDVEEENVKHLTEQLASQQEHASTFRSTAAQLESRLPEYEAEKKIAVTARNFKEAGRITKEIKDATQAASEAREKADVLLQSAAQTAVDLEAARQRAAEAAALRDATQRLADISTIHQLQLKLKQAKIIAAAAPDDTYIEAEIQALRTQLTELRTRHQLLEDTSFDELPDDDGDVTEVPDAGIMIYSDSEDEAAAHRPLQTIVEEPAEQAVVPEQQQSHADNEQTADIAEQVSQSAPVQAEPEIAAIVEDHNAVTDITSEPSDSTVTDTAATDGEAVAADGAAVASESAAESNDAAPAEEGGASAFSFLSASAESDDASTTTTATAEQVEESAPVPELTAEVAAARKDEIRSQLDELKQKLVDAEEQLNAFIEAEEFDSCEEVNTTIEQINLESAKLQGELGDLCQRFPDE
eukprot:TRINITY_DN1012_c0_g1_i1.p1 TRINITY_DN1012_c0_g1~~TRINITY_DN1012_c0_g1_i1.p1  ORF type:complete len:1206 (-),score=370.46 TRINITY_DN1012_c0_g1_i1:16-3633(-)